MPKMTSSPTHENQSLMLSLPATEENDRDSSHDQKSYLKLNESAPSWFWRVGISATLLLIPIAYLALIGMVASLRNKNQSSFGDTILELLKIASTLWPISFAAVIGPFLKTLALLRAERGSKLGSLEFLLTSQTTAAAFKNLFTLRCIRVWTVGIVALWCLSPLGGQAAVRSLQLQPTSISTAVPAMHYFSKHTHKVIESGHISNLTGDINVFDSQSSLINGLRSIVTSAFSRPDIIISHANGSSPNFDDAVSRLGGASQAVSFGQQDVWRNVRIPFMELLPDYDALNPTAWTPVPSDEVVPYASFIGVPIRGGTFPRAGNSTMTLQSRYLHLDCSDEFNGTSWLRLNTTSPRSYFHVVDSPQLSHQSFASMAASDLKTQPNMWLDIVTRRDLSAQHFNVNSSLTPSFKMQLIVGGTCLGDVYFDQTMLRLCNISTSYVDIAVECMRPSTHNDLECQAKKIRRAHKLPYSENLTDLSSLRTVSQILSEMPFTLASYGEREASLLEQFIRDPPMMFDMGQQKVREMHPACFSNLSTTVFGGRMAAALNTFLMATYNNSVLTGSDGTSLKNRNSMWQNSTATWMEFTGVIYVPNVAWFSVWVLSTLILFGCAVTNVVIRHNLMTPDFLDSVDGLTRDSRFIDIPEGGSGASSQDRLNGTKDILVQICDIQPNMDVGRIALTTEVKDIKLDWNRAYV